MNEQDRESLGGSTERRIIEISELAGGLAHEIRNPLSTLLLNLKLLDEDLGRELDAASDAVRRCRQRIGIARQEAERLQRMLDEFLLIVAPVGLHTQSVDLNDVVRRLIQFYEPEAARHRIELIDQCADEPIHCSIDPHVFRQAILNLMINAQQAMPTGGTLTLETRIEGDRAILGARDTGDGMPETVKDKAFQAFYSTKPNGSGLGLSTTSRIIHAHGGVIDLETTVGVGTCFRISLPVGENAA